MSNPDDQPTTVQRRTAAQPSVATAPESGRTPIWGRRLPARIGRARTSTVLLGTLFVGLFALWIAIRPAYVDVELPDGGTARVPCSQVSTCADPTPSDTPPPSESPTGPAEPTGASTSAPAPAPTSRTPQPTGQDDDETPASTPRTSRAPAPSSTAGTPTTTAEDPTTSAEQETEESPTEGTPTD
ncbi:hypothetical protein [Modestobacter sp. SYSU DS0290]